MTKTWTHPEIGEFVLDVEVWRTSWYEPYFENPGFTNGYRNEPVEPCDLIIEKREVSTQPEPAAISVLVDFWRARENAFDLTSQYLWKEMNGKIESENWWTDLKQWESSRLPKPTSHEELASALQLHVVSCRLIPEETGQLTFPNPFTGEVMQRPPKSVGVVRPAFWAIEFTFNASFEAEHGIGVLWHRGQVIGSGYGYGDCLPNPAYDPTV